MGKKRKYEVDVDAERTLYGSFVGAANSVSQLYAQAVQQQRKASAAAARQALERVLCHVLREYSGTDAIPKHLLLQFLQQEYENTEGSEAMPHHFPVQFIPMHGATAAPASHEDGGLPDATCKGTAAATRTGLHGMAGLGPSPARRTQHSTTMDMETNNNNSGGLAALQPSHALSAAGTLEPSPQQQQQQAQQHAQHAQPAGAGYAFGSGPAVLGSARGGSFGGLQPQQQQQQPHGDGGFGFS